MPSEEVLRPKPNRRRSSSRRSQTRETLTSPSTTPPQQHTNKRLHKHVVGAHRGGVHSRVPSTQKVKSQLQHGPDGEPMKRANSEFRLPRNGSTTSLRKNHSQVSLKRNKSAGEVRPKSSGHHSRHQSQQGRAAVHFEVGLEANDDANEDADGWTEASASPSLSRRTSIGVISGLHSRKHTIDNIQPRLSTVVRDEDNNTSNLQTEGFHTPNAKEITSKLLKRIPSLSAAPKMSTVSATVTPGGRSPEESLSKSQASTMGSNKEQPEISRFIGSTSGTPSDSPFLSNAAKTNLNTLKKVNVDLDHSKRAKSMGNLTRNTVESDGEEAQEEEEEHEERALAPRSRKASATSNHPSISRTQQKQLLQRASSHIEPQQLSRDPFSNLPPFGPIPLLGTSSYDGRDPRVRMQLERTGLEYLVVRRYQNPVGSAIRRLDLLPGAEKWVKIPSNRDNYNSSASGSGASRKGGRSRPLSENLASSSTTLGLSQSLKETIRHSVAGGGSGGGAAAGSDRLVNGLGVQGETAAAQRSSKSVFEGRTEHGAGSAGESDLSGNEGRRVMDRERRSRDGVKETLRSIWEKSFEMSASQE